MTMIFGHKLNIILKHASAKRAMIWANNTVFQCGNQCIKVKARFGWRQTVYKCLESEINDIISDHEQKQFDEMNYGVIGHCVYNIDFDGEISVDKVIKLAEINENERLKNKQLNQEIDQLNTAIFELEAERSDEIEKEILQNEMDTLFVENKNFVSEIKQLKSDMIELNLQKTQEINEEQFKNCKLMDEIYKLRMENRELNNNFKTWVQTNEQQQMIINGLQCNLKELYIELNTVVVEQIIKQQEQNELIYEYDIQSREIIRLTDELNILQMKLNDESTG
eukprot:460965_1